MGRRLPVNVDGPADVIQDLVESSKSSMVPPAIDVGCLNVEGFLAESFGDELGHAGFACPTWAGYDSGIGGLTAGDRLEDAGEMIDLSVTMLDFLWDEPSTEDTSITNHLVIGQILRQSYKGDWVVSGNELVSMSPGTLLDVFKKDSSALSLFVRSLFPERHYFRNRIWLPPAAID